MKSAHQSHLGHPYNLSFTPSVPETLCGYLINNLRDPNAGSHYASEVCAQEREVMAWLMRLWGCHNLDDFWGAVGASGTEGNLWGIYLGREMLPDAVLLYGADAHYSFQKPHGSCEFRPFRWPVTRREKSTLPILLNVSLIEGAGPSSCVDLWHRHERCPR